MGSKLKYLAGGMPLFEKSEKRYNSDRLQFEQFHNSHFKAPQRKVRDEGGHKIIPLTGTRRGFFTQGKCKVPSGCDLRFYTKVLSRCDLGSYVWNTLKYPGGVT